MPLRAPASALVIALLTVLASLGCAPGRAHADAIGGPPACPPGARGVTSHSGSWCVLDGCTSEADCERPSHCAPRRVCSAVFSVRVGGRGGHDEPPFETAEILETCAPDGACDGSGEVAPTSGERTGTGATCAVQSVCMLGALPSLATAPVDVALSPPRTGAPPTVTDTPPAAAPRAAVPIATPPTTTTTTTTTPAAATEPVSTCGCRTARTGATSRWASCMGLGALVCVWRSRRRVH